MVDNILRSVAESKGWDDAKKVEVMTAYINYLNKKIDGYTRLVSIRKLESEFKNYINRK